jgi:GNAT superfamily N-acetyltransferase
VITVRSADWSDPEGERLRAEQHDEIARRYGEDDTEPGEKPSAADVTVFLLAREATGRAVGCGALRALADGTGEIKRMYVEPAARGRGVARAVLAALEDAARSRHWHTLLLETGDRLHEAVRLYTKAGFVRVDNYGPYKGVTTSVCFAKALRPA